jgi:hypothetical protein
MYLGHFEVGFKQGNFFQNGTLTGLDIQENQGIYTGCHSYDGIDLFKWHPKPVFIAFAGVSLCSNRYIMQGWSDHYGRIRCLPLFYFGLQFRKHFICWIFSQNTHFFGIKVSVVGDNPVKRENGPGNRIIQLYRPATGAVPVTEGMKQFVIFSRIQHDRPGFRHGGVFGNAVFFIDIQPISIPAKKMFGTGGTVVEKTGDQYETGKKEYKVYPPWHTRSTGCLGYNLHRVLIVKKVITTRF